MIIRRTCLSLLLLIGLPVLAAESVEEVRQRFIGDYELVSYFTFPANGSEVDMNYVGRLSYDEFGNMSGLGMPKDLPQRSAEASQRVTGGFAYWGGVSFDTENKIVIHHVEGSPMVARWVGGDNIRHYEFDGDDILKLSLKNDAGRTTATLTWRRLK